MKYTAAVIAEKSSSTSNADRRRDLVQLFDLLATRLAAGVHGASNLMLLTGERKLATYTFNKHVIKHRFCKTCGVLPFGEGIDPQGEARPRSTSAASKTSTSAR